MIKTYNNNNLTKNDVNLCGWKNVSLAKSIAAVEDKCVVGCMLNWYE